MLLLKQPLILCLSSTITQQLLTLVSIIVQPGEPEKNFFEL